jgi:hypothetical protein
MSPSSADDIASAKKSRQSPLMIESYNWPRNLDHELRWILDIIY